MRLILWTHPRGSETSTLTGNPVHVARFQWLCVFIGTGLKTALLYAVSYQQQRLIIVIEPPVNPRCC
jgi:hypothetical protein